LDLEFFIYPSWDPVLSLGSSSGSVVGLTLGRGAGRKSEVAGLFHYKMGNAKNMARVAGDCHFDLPTSDVKIGIDVL